MKLFNINLESFLKTDKAKLIFSILIGFGIATLFRKACKERNCIVFKFPPLENVENKIFFQNNKCVKYTSENVKCSDNENIILEIDK